MSLNVDVTHLDVCAGNCIAAVELASQTTSLRATDTTEHNVFDGDSYVCDIRKYGSTFYIGIAMVVLPYFGPCIIYKLMSLNR